MNAIMCIDGLCKQITLNFLSVAPTMGDRAIGIIAMVLWGVALIVGWWWVTQRKREAVALLASKLKLTYEEAEKLKRL